MRASRLAVALGLAGWLVGGVVGYYFDGGLGLGLLAGLLAAVLGAVLGGTADLLQAIDDRRPLTLPQPRSSVRGNPPSWTTALS